MATPLVPGFEPLDAAPAPAARPTPASPVEGFSPVTPTPTTYEPGIGMPLPDDAPRPVKYGPDVPFTDVRQARKAFTDGGNSGLEHPSTRQPSRYDGPLAPLWKESFPEYATRHFLKQSPSETFADSALTTMALHLNRPAEAALGGIENLVKGGTFSEGYRDKKQEIDDTVALGHHQNPITGYLGNAAGSAVDYARFGPAIRAGAEYIPGVAAVTRSGPLGDQAVKFGALGAADRFPQSAEGQALNTKGTSLIGRAGDVASDTIWGGLEGATGAVLGSTVGKTLGVGGPIVSSIGKGFEAADSFAKGVPRSAYSWAGNKLSSNFTGAGDNLTQAALKRDIATYGKFLDKGAIDVPKAVDQLTKMIEEDPHGMGLRIIKSATNNVTDPRTKALLESAITDLERGNPEAVDGSLVAKFRAALQAQTNPEVGQIAGVLAHPEKAPASLNPLSGPGLIEPRMPSNADGGVSQFLKNIYREIIPDRLAGPVDAASQFERNSISGRLADRGKLIAPPFTGATRQGAAMYERLGGGPGLVAGPLGYVGQAVNWPVLQVPSIAANVGGKALDWGGRGIGWMAEPGTTAGNVARAMTPESLEKGVKDFASHMPSYRNPPEGASPSEAYGYWGKLPGFYQAAAQPTNDHTALVDTPKWIQKTGTGAIQGYNAGKRIIGEDVPDWVGRQGAGIRNIILGK